MLGKTKVARADRRWTENMKTVYPPQTKFARWGRGGGGACIITELTVAYKRHQEEEKTNHDG